MRIAIPKEIKVLEGRVGLIPAAVAELTALQHEVFIETQAGQLSGYSDDEYRAVGATVLPDAKSVYEAGEIIVKVKEPQAADLEHLKSHHILFCYLHLAAEPTLLKALLSIGLTGVAFETVSERGQLPLLAPMSDIAGRIAAQVGCHYLHQPLGGRGVLMGGLPAASRGNAVVIGAGVAGGNAAAVLAGMGVNVTVFDKRMDRLEAMRALGANVTSLYPFRADIERALTYTDLLIGAVLIPGAKAPYVVTKSMVRKMPAGSVIIDISVDQGGCIETTRPTNYLDPTYTWEGVVHFGVTNMPGAVPRTASQALSAAVTPYLMQLAQPGWEKNQALAAGINVQQGKLMLEALKH